MNIGLSDSREWPPSYTIAMPVALGREGRGPPKIHMQVGGLFAPHSEQNEGIVQKLVGNRV